MAKPDIQRSLITLKRGGIRSPCPFCSSSAVSDDKSHFEAYFSRLDLWVEICYVKSWNQRHNSYRLSDSRPLLGQSGDGSRGRGKKIRRKEQKGFVKATTLASEKSNWSVPNPTSSDRNDNEISSARCDTGEDWIRESFLSQFLDVKCEIPLKDPNIRVRITFLDSCAPIV